MPKRLTTRTVGYAFLGFVVKQKPSVKIRVIRFICVPLRLCVRCFSLRTLRHGERNAQTTDHKDRGLRLSGFCGKTKTIRENPHHPFHPCSIAPLHETPFSAHSAPLRENEFLHC